MERYKNIPIVKQPKNLKMNLFKHQLAAIFKMEDRENNKDFQRDDNIDMIKTNIGIYSDLTGFGKTLSIIGLICRDKMEWDLEIPYISDKIIALYGNGHIIRYKKKEYEKLNCNLVITGQSIISQWEDELKHSNLKYYSITTRKKTESCDPTKYDVILCSPTMYNFLVQRFSKNIWKRLIYDEPCHIKIKAMREIMAGHYWFITATPCMLPQTYRTRAQNFLSMIFSGYIDYGTFCHLIIKNDDEFVKLSYNLPPTNYKYYKCYQPVFNILKGVVSVQLSEMIAAGNIEGAVRLLGGNKTDNIIELVKTKKQEELNVIEFKIVTYTRRNIQERIDYWVDRKVQIEDQIKELDNRFKNYLSSNCNICLDNIEKPVLLTCCQNLFCGSCIIEWFKNNNTCPMCRAKISSEFIIYIKTDDCKKEKEEKEEQTLTKPNVILNLIKENPKGKFIIFSSYDESAIYIRNKLDENNIDFCEIHGRAEVREKTIKSFKSSKLNVLFLNSLNNGAGINLQEATDIILYHEMDSDIKTQIEGRANRIGRTIPLTVHHLI